MLFAVISQAHAVAVYDAYPVANHEDHWQMLLRFFRIMLLLFIWLMLVLFVFADAVAIHDDVVYAV
jgi:hypothetical protein